MEPSQKSNSIYDEVDPKVWLDLYGNELPTKVEAWSAGPAETIEDKWKHAKKVNALKYNWSSNSVLKLVFVIRVYIYIYCLYYVYIYIVYVKIIINN